MVENYSIWSFARISNDNAAGILMKNIEMIEHKINEIMHKSKSKICEFYYMD